MQKVFYCTFICAKLKSGNWRICETTAIQKGFECRPANCIVYYTRLELIMLLRSGKKYLLSKKKIKDTLNAFFLTRERESPTTASFWLASWTVYVKNSKTQLCFLLLLVVLVFVGSCLHSPMPRHCAVQIVSPIFRMAHTSGKGCSICVYYFHPEYYSHLCLGVGRSVSVNVSQLRMCFCFCL